MKIISSTLGGHEIQVVSNSPLNRGLGLRRSSGRVLGIRSPSQSLEMAVEGETATSRQYLMSRIVYVWISQTSQGRKFVGNTAI